MSDEPTVSYDTVYKQCSNRFNSIEEKLDRVIMDNAAYRRENQRLTNAVYGLMIVTLSWLGYFGYTFLPSKLIKFVDMIRKTGLSG